MGVVFFLRTFRPTAGSKINTTSRFPSGVLDRVGHLAAAHGNDHLHTAARSTVFQRHDQTPISALSVVLYATRSIHLIPTSIVTDYIMKHLHNCSTVRLLFFSSLR